MQRVNYFSSIFYFFHGWSRLIYLAAPLSYLLLNYPPVVAKFLVLLSYFLPYYITSLVAFNLISKGFRNPFWSDVYETVMCFFISWTAIETLLQPKKARFHVTPKGVRFDKPQLDWSYVMPHIFLLIVLMVGLGVGGYRLWQEELNLNATLLSVFWTLYNLVILVAAIVVARERPQKRFSPRLFRQIACELHFDGRTLSGKTTDISEAGLSMTLDRPLLLTPVSNVRLVSDFGETTEIQGEMTRNDYLPSGQVSVGIRFVNVTDAQHQSLIRQMYSSPTSWEQVHQATSTTWRSFAYLATSSIRAFITEKVLRRFSPRIRKQMACDLIVGERVFKGITQDISNTGLSVRLETHERLPKAVTIQLYQGNRMVLNVRGEIIRLTKTMGTQVIYGIRFLERKDLELSTLV
jgi:cellulose synthase (UDP-forming)